MLPDCPICHQHKEEPCLRLGCQGRAHHYIRTPLGEAGSGKWQLSGHYHFSCNSSRSLLNCTLIAGLPTGPILHFLPSAAPLLSLKLQHPGPLLHQLMLVLLCLPAASPQGEGLVRAGSIPTAQGSYRPADVPAQSAPAGLAMGPADCWPWHRKEGRWVVTSKDGFSLDRQCPSCLLSPGALPKLVKVSRSALPLSLARLPVQGWHHSAKEDGAGGRQPEWG